MNSLETFQKECPELKMAYTEVIKILINSPVISPKTKQLLYIAMKVVTDDNNAVIHHIPMAKNEGATKDEIIEVLKLTITVIGLNGISKYLPIVMKIYT